MRQSSPCHGGFVNKAYGVDPSRGQRDLVGMAVEMHHHARQQSAALVKFTKVEIADLKSVIGSNVLQLSVFVDFVLVVLRSRFQVVNVRGVQHRVWQTNGVADARITFVFGDGNDVRYFLELRGFLLADQIGAGHGVLPVNREENAVEMVNEDTANEDPA